MSQGKLEIDPALADAVLDMDKLRAFLSAPKAAVVAREADCTCGPYRASDKPKPRRRKAKARR